MIIQARLLDLHQRRIYSAEINVENGRIAHIQETDKTPELAGYLMPGFVDAHVHVESSMLPPGEFARMAVVHGTVATVSDPHEIANVLGADGVQFMLDDAARSPLKFCFGAPSCVPATSFETAGATLDADAVEALLRNPAIGYLSEMMNFPGVLFEDAQVMAKIAAAKRLGKPVDGHAPGLRGDDARRYFAAGITTDHECFTYEEGREKASLGVKILIREGSAARNFEALWPLINEFPEQVMFCSDDKHPDDLVSGHINALVARAVAKGCDLFDTLRAACIHPVEHYRLPVGLLREGDPADFVLVEDLQDFRVTSAWINGEKVSENGQPLLSQVPVHTPNFFVPRNFETFPGFEKIAPNATLNARIIRIYDGEIVTGAEIDSIKTGPDGIPQADPSRDILYITVVNRYSPDAKPSLGLVHGAGLKYGALASSVAHDSHNIVAIGDSLENLAAAVNAVMDACGGISATDGKTTRVLGLPIAGLMSPLDGWQLAQEYSEIDAWVKHQLGCPLRAPFMSLSFLALPVIPHLKMTDLGLFDVDQFAFTQTLND